MQHWCQEQGLTRVVELPLPKQLPEAAFVLLSAEWWWGGKRLRCWDHTVNGVVEQLGPLSQV